MSTVPSLILLGLVAVAVIVQLRHVPRMWAFLFLFVVVFPKIALTTIPDNPTPLRVDDLVLGAVLGGWLIKEALIPRKPIPHPAVLVFLVAYLGCAATSSFLGMATSKVSPATATFHFLRLTEYALLYLYFYRKIDPEELPQVREVFRNTWLIIAVVWIAQHGLAAKAPAGAILDLSTYFPSFSASYDFGGYVMIATAVCYALWIERRTRDAGTTLALLAALYILFNGDSRASLVGFGVAIVFDLFFRLRLKVALGFLGVAAVLPYVISSAKMTQLFAIVSTLNLETMRRAFLSDPSILVRLRNWQLALERWRQAPLFGDGLGSFLAYVRIYDQAGTPDGWYIRMLAEVGLLGLLAFVMMIGCLLWVLLNAYRAFDRPLPRAMVYGAVLALVATATNALLIDTFVSYKIMGVFWMVMAVGTRLATEWAPTTDAATAPTRDPLLGGESVLMPDLDPSAPGSVS